MPRPTEKRTSRLIKVLSILNNHQGGLWMREIARQSGIHLEEIRRLITNYPEFFEQYADFTPYNINLKIIKSKNPSLSPKNIRALLKNMDS